MRAIDEKETVRLVQRFHQAKAQAQLETMLAGGKQVAHTALEISLMAEEYTESKADAAIWALGWSAQKYIELGEVPV